MTISNNSKLAIRDKIEQLKIRKSKIVSNIQFLKNKLDDLVESRDNIQAEIDAMQVDV